MGVRVLVFSPQTSGRLLYALDLVGRAYPGATFSVVADAAEYQHSDALRLNYSAAPVADREVWIQPAGLLFETGTRAVAPDFLEAMRRAVGCGPDGGDLLSFIFYTVIRYEEYNLPAERLDAHGRFVASESLAGRWGVLRRPVADEWAGAIWASLRAVFPATPPRILRYAFLPTYDIDSAWRFSHKGFWRNLAGAANDLLQGEASRLVSRVKTLAGIRADPDHTFDLMDDLARRYELRPVFFWLLADVRRPFDTNIPADRPVLRSLIRRVAATCRVGAHPSYQSNSDSAVLEMEIGRLRELIPPVSEADNSFSRSRQHFLKLRFPETYRRLIEAGVREDYTMGFSDDLGFRAGTASPFFWYDLEREEKTGLRVFPFEVMDVTLQKYLKLTPAEAVRQTAAIAETVRSVGGVFCTLWHNSSLSGEGEWKNWRAVYEEIILSSI